MLSDDARLWIDALSHLIAIGGGIAALALYLRGETLHAIWWLCLAIWITR